MIVFSAGFASTRDSLLLVFRASAHCSQDKNKTFKPKKPQPKGTKRYELHKQAKATLGSGNLRLAVKLPEREDINEWLAVNSTFADIPVGCQTQIFIGVHCSGGFL